MTSDSGGVLVLIEGYQDYLNGITLMVYEEEMIKRLDVESEQVRHVSKTVVLYTVALSYD